MSETSLVRPLEAFRRADIATAGGKGANLGELIHARFPVPAGFVVTTEAYELFLASAGLAERVPELLRADPQGGSLRNAIEAAEPPKDLVNAIRQAYRDLGGGPVAVRSSATAEDLPDAAFAGQQETALNVIGDDEVIHAVRRCWASLWSERAISYRGRQAADLDETNPSLTAGTWRTSGSPGAGAALDQARIAVVVQQMAPAEAAGVLFTANPVTGTRDEVVIDANPGLGEAVVSGMVTPDHYTLTRRGRVKEHRSGKREVVIHARPDGGTERVSEPAANGSIPRSALRRLARLGVAIEDHFGVPQDIEWAWADGKAHIVQARPITALPEPRPKAHRVERLGAGILSEIVPMRPYPLDMTTWTDSLVDALTGFLGRIGIRYPPIDQIFIEEEGVVVRIEPPRPRPTPKVLLGPLRLLRDALRYDPREWESEPELVALIERIESARTRDLESLVWGEMLATLRELLTSLPSVFNVRVRYMPRSVFALVYVALILTLTGNRHKLSHLFSTDDIKTTEINRELERLAAEIRSDPELAHLFAAHDQQELRGLVESQPFANRFKDFLERYGHRETVSPGLASQPTWSAVPEVVLGILKGLAAAPPREATTSPAAVLRSNLLRHPLVRIPVVRPLTGRALDLVTWFVRMREDTRFYVTLALPQVRGIMLELGTRLAESDALESPEDVFHLRLNELESAWPPSPELRKIVEKRRNRRDSLGDAPLLDPRLLMPDPGTEAPADALLTGTPGSPGVAEGPARIVLGAHEFGKLRPGDVLVAPYTHPAWTPLFQRAAAVVVDSGGPASHAAIVAREYGIPAVMATARGTTALVDDQSIRVDGDRGIVLPG